MAAGGDRKSAISGSDAMTARRPIVLVPITYYLPGYKSGGPIRTLRNLVAALGDEFDFRILTSDHEVGERKPYAGVAFNAWTAIEGAHVFYADAAARRPWQLAATIAAAAPDIIYLNSFFSPGFTIVPLVLRRLGWLAAHKPWVIATRGELSRGALAIKSLRKRSYVAASRIAGLHRGVMWQVSSPHEAADLEREVGAPRDTIHVAPNLTAPVEPDLPAVDPCRDSSRLSIVFLARICEMKNLSFAIDTLEQCGHPTDLHVFGPVEDQAYAARCRARIPRDGSALRVTWHGEVPPEQVRAVLAGHDLFFLPTLGENFGHGIFEALAAGVPVLVSDRTPWRDLDAAGVGWVLPLENQRRFISAIEALASMTPDARLAMRRRAHAYATRVAASSDAIEANRRLFRAALEQASGAQVGSRHSWHGARPVEP